MYSRLKRIFHSGLTHADKVYYDTDSVATKQAFNRLYGMSAIDNLDELREEIKRVDIYKVRETIICDGKRKKSVTFYSHKKYLDYISHLDDFTNRGIVHYTLNRSNFDVQVKIYM